MNKSKHDQSQTHLSADGRRRQGWHDPACHVRRESSGLAGVQFQEALSQELDHNFLWRFMKSLPGRGRIGIFNRSYYEDVLVVPPLHRS